MAVIPFVAPRLYGIPGVDSPSIAAYAPAQAAAFREGDFLAQITTGTIVVPTGGLSTLATFAGPSPGQDVNLPLTSSTVTANNVTVAGAAASGAAAQSYYVILTYTATGKESLSGAEFIVNCGAGVVPNITVSATGAPAGTTNWACYAGTYSGGEALQQATTTTTATGAAFALSNPLTNNIGVNRAATNASASIVGLALNDSAAVYAQGVGGAATVGGPGNLLGAWGNPFLQGNDAIKSLVAKLTGSAPIEISLKQAYADSLIGTTAGIALDSATGVFVADNAQSNKILTIIDKVTGSNADVGTTGDTGARVKCIFSSGVI